MICAPAEAEKSISTATGGKKRTEEKGTEDHRAYRGTEDHRDPPIISQKVFFKKSQIFESFIIIIQ